jgi:hypothetical protein
MYVCGHSTATRTGAWLPCAPGAPARARLGDPSEEAVLGSCELPALDERLGDHEADVVTRAGMLAPGISEPDDQPVDRPATPSERASQQLLLA